MGITIHYKGKIKSLDLIDAFQEEIADICQTMNWDYHLWNEDWSKPFNATLDHDADGAHIRGHIPLRGITMEIDPDFETFNLLFNPAGQLSTFMLEIMKHDGTLKPDFSWVSIKTQFGEAQGHIGIVKLLRYLKKRYIPDLEVYDEGDYWETGNKERLLEKRGFLFEKMNQLENALSSIKIKENATPEELVEKIETILKKLLKKHGDDH